MGVAMIESLSTPRKEVLHVPGTSLPPVHWSISVPVVGMALGPWLRALALNPGGHYTRLFVCSGPSGLRRLLRYSLSFLWRQLGRSGFTPLQTP